MTTKTVPSHYSLLWIQTAMKITERHYWLFVACTLSAGALTGAFGFIPMIGDYLATVLNFVLTLGFYKTTRRLFRGEAITFDIYLQETFDTKSLKEVLPMLAIAVAATAILNSSEFVPLYKPIRQFISIFYYFVESICVYAAINKISTSLSWEESFITTLEGVGKNIVPLGAYVLFLILFLVGCTLLCVVPLFFYGLPVLFTTNYLVYNCIFGDMDLDAVYRAWSQKPQTPVLEVILPPSDPPTV